MRAENEELKASFKSGYKELAAASTTAYASDLKDSQVTINLLQAETTMLNIYIGGLKAENMELQAELATANTTNSRLKAQNGGQQAELKTAADDNAAYRARLERMTHKNTELCELYKTALGEFKAHTDDLNIKVDTTADDRAASKAKLERISCEIVEFQYKLTIANRRKAHSENHNLRDQLTIGATAVDSSEGGDTMHNIKTQLAETQDSLFQVIFELDLEDRLYTATEANDDLLDILTNAGDLVSGIITGVDTAMRTKLAKFSKQPDSCYQATWVVHGRTSGGPWARSSAVTTSEAAISDCKY
ncbi:hypothetical protein LPJ66_004031 [Kickxella alabastrina]|uniref:Uncharacterized protein n=1 Tax=Kickxella alabastrina TaxID=61397 RepID=A0ACC1IM91_9FUNG|nr:hypothetical protein LPJ66_004031 [Kickxella alabastrina]